MHAIAIESQRLEWREHEAPGPVGAGEVRIEVAWAGVNRADLMQRAGKYPPPPGAPDIPGLEVSGTIAEVGPRVERFRRQRQADLGQIHQQAEIGRASCRERV